MFLYINLEIAEEINLYLTKWRLEFQNFLIAMEKLFYLYTVLHMCLVDKCDGCSRLIHLTTTKLVVSKEFLYSQTFAFFAFYFMQYIYL